MSHPTFTLEYKSIAFGGFEVFLNKSSSYGSAITKIPSYHISCDSDLDGNSPESDWTTKRYGGIIIYSLGTAKIKTGKKIKPGYIYILNLTKLGTCFL